MSHLIRTALECVFFYKTNQQFKGGRFHLIEFLLNAEKLFNRVHVMPSTCGSR